MPQGPGTYGSQRGRPPKKNNLMRKSVLKKAAEQYSYTPGTEEQMFREKPKLDPMLYDEKGRRRKKPLSKEEQQKIMRPTLGTKKTRKRVPGDKTEFSYDEDKFGFPGIYGGD